MASSMFYSELFGLLTLEFDVLQQVLELSTQQQKALIGFQSARIEEIARELEGHTRQIDECEMQRIRLVSATFGIHLSEARRLRLSDLCAMVSSEHVDELLRFQTLLKDLSQRIQFVNTVNRVLALRGRNSVKATLDHIRSIRSHMINASL